jgi:hypothetical protein
VDFVQRVVDTVNEYDNVLYEISNESGPESIGWQEHIVQVLQEYESTKPKRHPVILSAPWGNREEDLWASRAEAVSPALPQIDMPAYAYRDDPPANDGRKVIINDTDHLWGIGGTRSWVWRSFVGGLNPIYMDPYDPAVHKTLYELGRETRDEVLGALAQTRRLAQRLPLESMTPRQDLCSGGYCLIAADRAYLAYVPTTLGDKEAGAVEIDMEASSGSYEITWLELERNKQTTEVRQIGPGRQTFTSPSAGEAVLILQRRDAAR